MKTFLQKYDFNTRQMLAGSLALIVAGLVIYSFWSGFGVVPLAIGAAGLVWCYLRR